MTSRSRAGPYAARAAMAQAPDDASRRNLETLIQQIEAMK